MEPYVVFHHLAFKCLVSYDWHRHCLMVGRFLTASEDVYPIYDLIPMEGCTQATLIEDCLLNLVNKYETIAMSSLQKLQSSAKFIRLCYIR